MKYNLQKILNRYIVDMKLILQVTYTSRKRKAKYKHHFTGKYMRNGKTVLLQ